LGSDAENFSFEKILPPLEENKKKQAEKKIVLPWTLEAIRRL